MASEKCQKELAQIVYRLNMYHSAFVSATTKRRGDQLTF